MDRSCPRLAARSDPGCDLVHQPRAHPDQDQERRGRSDRGHPHLSSSRHLPAAPAPRYAHRYRSLDPGQNDGNGQICRHLPRDPSSPLPRDPHRGGPLERSGRHFHADRGRPAGAGGRPNRLRRDTDRDRIRACVGARHRSGVQRLCERGNDHAYANGRSGPFRS